MVKLMIMKVYRVKVISGAPKSEMRGQMTDGTLKVAIQAIAEKGKANLALISFLAKEFRVEKDKIEILSGASSHLKLIRIS